MAKYYDEKVKNALTIRTKYPRLQRLSSTVGRYGSEKGKEDKRRE